MEQRTPTRRSSRSVRGVLCALAISPVALAGCGGGGSPRPPEEAQVETLDAEREATEEVGRLGIRDAVGQMFVVGTSGPKPDYYIEKMVRERNIGGVLLFGYNTEPEEQKRSLVGSLQELAMQPEPAIPSFIAVDHEGGDVQSPPWVSAQPSAEEVGGQADPDEARRIAERIGRELRRGGVNTDLAPVVDTGGGAAIGNRSYGVDPPLVASMGAAAVRGFEQAGIVSVAKRFPNHGASLEDSHINRPRIDHDARTFA